VPLKSFNITNVKIINKAFCENVPKLMIIAGPNGVGKSTLLYELRRLSGDNVKGSGKILYVGPHRTWRRRSIRTGWLWGAEKDYSSILTADEIPSFEGIGVQDHHRRPDSTDEAPGFIKYILAQLETRRQNAIVSEIDRNDLKYPEGCAPDVYKPLKDMITTLLPHLDFVGVDLKNRENVTCLLKVEGVLDPIDVDDLSSGEKEIIALFMPLLERQISYVLRRIEKGKEPDLDITPDTVIIIDEPDLHIHPELQKRMIKYMREKAYSDNIQFIIATHSPIIMNEATSDELFALVTRDKAGSENQLRRIISNQEKFDLFKYVCGDVAILTLGNPVVFIEGKDPGEARTAPSDQRILELLFDEARDFNFVSLGGKTEVEKATLLLNQILTEKLVGFPVYAIIDADLDVKIDNSSLIFRWKFCTIENALLDPLSIFEVLEPYKEKTGILTKEQVEVELLEICKEITPDEKERRLRKMFPSFHFNFRGKNIEELVKEREGGIEELKKYFTNQEEIDKQIQNINEEVEKMFSDKSVFLKFNGKEVLRKFYQKNVSEKDIGMSFEVFCYSVAKRIGETDRTPVSIKETLTSIQKSLKAQ
jgi:predicted ATPase